MIHVKSLGMCQSAWHPAADKVAVDHIKTYGATFVDLFPSKYDPTLDDTSQQWKIIAEFWQSSDIEIRSVQGFLFNSRITVGAPKDSEKFRNIMYKVARIAVALGAKNLIYGAPQTRPLENSVEAIYFIEEMDWAGKLAADFGLRLLVENLPQSCMGKVAASAFDLVTRLADLNENVFACCDIGNMATWATSLRSLDEQYAALAGTQRVAHFQLNTGESTPRQLSIIDLLGRRLKTLDHLSLETKSFSESAHLMDAVVGLSV